MGHSYARHAAEHLADELYEHVLAQGHVRLRLMCDTVASLDARHDPIRQVHALWLR